MQFIHDEYVSTHSRPKAAGNDVLHSMRTQPFQHTAARRRLALPYHRFGNSKKFQHTAARRRLVSWFENQIKECDVSTHSRPKAAGIRIASLLVSKRFQHTAARRRLGHSDRQYRLDHTVSTHSRPKAAGYFRFKR